MMVMIMVFCPFDNDFDSWGFEGVQYTQGYPYVGHYDNPYTPTDDINFGQLRGNIFHQQLLLMIT